MQTIMTNRLDRGFKMYQEEFEKKAVDVLRSGWYIMGNELRSFEESFANYTGATWYPGLNPYIDEAFDPANISLSPNWDGYADYLEDIYVSLLRNARTLNFTWTDAVTGEVYFDEQIENVSKSFFMDSYQQIVPYVYTWYSYPYDMTDAEGNPLANNTKVNLSIGSFDLTQNL